MIDEKGKLFGKVNIVDLLIVLLVVVVAGYFGYKHFMAPAEQPVSKNATVVIMAANVLPEVADKIKAGDQMVARGALQQVFVREVRIEAAKSVEKNVDGFLVQGTHPFRKDVYLTLEGPISYVGDEINFLGQSCRIGIGDGSAGTDKFIVKSQNYQLQATILDIVPK